MSQHPNHIPESPLTYSHHRLSRPKMIFTILLITIVSISLLVGGTMGYIGMKSDHFILINGQEVITPEILESIRTNIVDANLNPQDRMSALMRYLGPIQQSIMWMAYGKSRALNFQPVDLSNALMHTYKETKDMFQKESHTYFNMSYEDFVNRNLKTFNLQSIFSAISFPIPADHYNIAQEYFADNTTSTIEYHYIDRSEYLVDTHASDLQAYYTAHKEIQVIGSKILKVVSFDSMAEANKKSQEWQNVKNSKDISQLQKSMEQLTLSKQDKNVYLFVQDIKVGGVTPAFSYHNKFYVGLVQQEIPLEWAFVGPLDKQHIANSYYDSLPANVQKGIVGSLSSELEHASIKPFLHQGTSQPIGINKMQDLKDAKTSQPLQFGSINNQEFFLEAFHNIGYTSPVLSYMNQYYVLKVLKNNTPVFPISEKSSPGIIKSIEDREKNMWLLYHNAAMQKEINVDIDIKNLGNILR